MYSFIYSFTGEGRRLETNCFNEELSYLTMQNKVLHDTANFRSTFLKMSCQIKSVEQGKNKD